MSDVQIICKPNVFDRDSTVFADVQAGKTLAEMLGPGVSQTAQVTIDGYPVARELWAHVKPKAGKQVHVLLYPQGGKARKWVAMILMVVVTVLTYGAASGWFATGANLFAAGSTSAMVLAAGISVVGSLLINQLVAPPTPKGGVGAGDPFQQLSSITGTSNAINPYGVIPCVVGTCRFFPPHAAMPYTELMGDQQFLRMLLELGYGDLTVSDIKIGETPIDDFDDVEYEISKTPTLFTQDIYELSVGTTLDDGASDTRTTQASSEEISLDLIASSGLFGVSNKNKTLTATATFSIQYREINDTDWTSVTSASGLKFSNSGMTVSGTSIHIASSARKTLRCGLRWKVATGQYQVKVTRGTTSYPGAMDQGKVGTFIWSVLRSISHSLPSTTNTNKLAVRIKATDQLQGVVQNLSVLASQNIRTWNKSTQSFTTPAVSTNPAWCSAWLYTQCEAVVRRVADDRLDWDGYADWANECNDKGLKVGFIMDSPRAFSDWQRDVLASGRGSFGFRNGLISAVRDVAQTVPVQMFTPANSWGFKYSRSFVQLPHALRCKFVNPEASYKQDFVTVYAPGYSAANATRFETLDLGPVIDPDAAWRLGTYHMAVLYNRPTQYEFMADIENLVCERGDLVSVAHDVTGWGVAWGRVTAVSGNTVTLDGSVTLESGKSYRLSIRTSANDQATYTVTTSAGDRTALTLSTAPTVEVGDLWVLGVVNQGLASLVIRQIEPAPDFTAKLTCVDAAPDVWTADSGTPPPFVSNITGDIFCEAPPVPSITIIESDQRLSLPNDAGITDPGVNLGVGGGVGTGILRLGNTTLRGALPG